jgi:hypothetical protein
VLTALQGLIYALREVITSENPIIHPELASVEPVISAQTPNGVEPFLSAQTPTGVEPGTSSTATYLATK